MVKCIVCKRKNLSKQHDFKKVDEVYTSSSGKLLKAVLLHILKCTQINLQILPENLVCLKCYNFLLKYDEHVVRLMGLQKQFKMIYENSNAKIKAPPADRIIDLRAELGEVPPKIEANSDGEGEFIVIETDEHRDADMHSLSEESGNFEGSVKDEEDDDAVIEDIEEKSTQEKEVLAFENKEAKCPYCKISFPNRSRLRKHVQATHTKKEHFCKICGVSCKDEEYLELHMNLHEGKTEYECRYCDKRFNKKSNVVRHMAKHWDKKKYQCEKCGLQFSETPLLYNHKLLHDAEENPLICNICNMKCKTIRTYKRHMNTHREDRPRYPCHICGKTFSEKFTLKPHLKTHAEYVEALSAHKKPAETVVVVTEEIESSEPDTSHICVICGMLFTNNHQFNKHMANEHDVIEWGA